MLVNVCMLQPHWHEALLPLGKGTSRSSLLQHPVAGCMYLEIPAGNIWISCGVNGLAFQNSRAPPDPAPCS